MFFGMAVNLKRPACAIAVLSCIILALSPITSFAQSQPQVKFTLKSDSADTTAIDVKLSFTMKAGQKAVVKPSEQTKLITSAGPPPALESLPMTNPSFSVEVLQGPDSGWMLTASKDGSIDFPYKVRFSAAKGTDATVAGEAPGGVAPPRAITSQDMKAFMASDVLLVPQSPSGDYLSNNFSVTIQTSDGENALVPWTAGSTGSYAVTGIRQLMANFVAWGKITKVNLRSAGPSITAGFSSEYKKFSDKERSNYGNDLLKIYDEVRRVFGQRSDQQATTVLVTGSGAYGLNHPAAESLRDSFVLFHGGSKLEQEASAAASKGWINLWNGWSLVARKNGHATWLQAGLPWFYSFRVAGRVGLMDANSAYQDFSGVYADYLSDPLALTTSLVQAETQSGAQRLLETKGAAVLASMAVKLTQKDTGGSKDIEWFIGQLAKKFNGLEGEEYSLVDVSEILEDGTGTSWDRFFSNRTGTDEVILASQWSTTDVFGSGGVVGGARKLSTKGSGKNWIYLAIAILVIFSIPFIFSTYIKRSIKLDVSMPKILPDWDDETPDSTQDARKDDNVVRLETGNPVGEAITEVPAGEGIEGGGAGDAGAPAGDVRPDQGEEGGGPPTGELQ